MFFRLAANLRAGKAGGAIIAPHTVFETWRGGGEIRFWRGGRDYDRGTCDQECGDEEVDFCGGGEVKDVEEFGAKRDEEREVRAEEEAGGVLCCGG